MKKWAIIEKETGTIVSRYESEELVEFGGEWGSEAFAHVEIPAGMNVHCLTVEPDAEAESGFSISEDSGLRAAVDAAATKAMYEKIVADARAFGQKLADEFSAENIQMGITQDNMTGTVRKALTEVTSALSTGSLYDAIEEIRAIPPEKKDVKYITDARLLAAINKIEAYLNIALSEEL